VTAAPQLKPGALTASRLVRMVPLYVNPVMALWEIPLQPG
jgi:hypothetical protein